MNCDFLERHFISGASPEGFEVHRSQCADCRRLSAELIRLAALESGLSAPDPAATLVAGWRAIPARTINCERASELTARSIEEPLADSDRARWQTHLDRCADCRETAAVLGMMPELKHPTLEAPLGPADRAATLANLRKIASSAPGNRIVSIDARRPKRAVRAVWMDPRFYAAAACLLAGFFALFANTLDVRASTQSLESEVRVRWAEASDRFQLWEQGASRQWVATRESLTGYTKAAGAIALSAASRVTEGLFHNETKTEKGKKS
jgi:hypothetical protein